MNNISDTQTDAVDGASIQVPASEISADCIRGTQKSRRKQCLCSSCKLVHKTAVKAAHDRISGSTLSDPSIIPSWNSFIHSFVSFTIDYFSYARMDAVAEIYGWNDSSETPVLIPTFTKGTTHSF